MYAQMYVVKGITICMCICMYDTYTCVYCIKVFIECTYNKYDAYVVYITIGRLRVNMGNIYFEQKKYPQAVKMYRMALDQIQNVHKDVRCVSVPYIGSGWGGAMGSQKCYND